MRAIFPSRTDQPTAPAADPGYDDAAVPLGDAAQLPLTGAHGAPAFVEDIGAFVADQFTVETTKFEAKW